MTKPWLSIISPIYNGEKYLSQALDSVVIQEDNDNGAFPYEIWKYAKINNTGQTNVKFIFPKEGYVIWVDNFAIPKYASIWTIIGLPE